MRSGTLFNALAITDSSDHISDTLTVSTDVVTLFAAYNTLDQAITLQYAGSFDGIVWFALDAPPVLAIGNVTATTDLQTITDPWPKIRVTATAGGVPTTGTLTLWWATQATGVH